jgi:hypothetical protein
MVLTAYNAKAALQLTHSISEHSGRAIALHVMLWRMDIGFTQMSCYGLSFTPIKTSAHTIA